jgi:hypothetical protein
MQQAHPGAARRTCRSSTELLLSRCRSAAAAALSSESGEGGAVLLPLLGAGGAAPRRVRWRRRALEMAPGCCSCGSPAGARCCGAWGGSGGSVRDAARRGSMACSGSSSAALLAYCPEAIASRMCRQAWGCVVAGAAPSAGCIAPAPWGMHAITLLGAVLRMQSQERGRARERARAEQFFSKQIREGQSLSRGVQRSARVKRATVRGGYSSALVAWPL